MTAFPLSPAPSWYTNITPGRHQGLFTLGLDTPSFMLSKAGADHYEVRDYSGAIVSSGSISGTSLSPAAPAAGWALGWYRLYITGPNTDALFGSSYGASTFCLIRNNAYFPNAPAPTTANGAQYSDRISCGVLAAHAERWSVHDATAPTTDAEDYKISGVQTGATLDKSYWMNPAYQDAARPRYELMSFPNGTTDMVGLSDSNGWTLGVYPLNGSIDTSSLYVGVATGTNAGFRVTLYSPDTSTVVEDYDNLLSPSHAVDAITRNSALIKVFSYGGHGNPLAAAPVLIGNAYRSGVIQTVQSLYPDVTRFEGPSNEPQGTQAIEVAHRTRLFYEAVKAANGNAIVVGPQPVSVNAGTIHWVDQFLAAAGGDWVDEFSYHGYNCINGDLGLGRTVLERFAGVLAKYNFTKPLWQTEQGVFTPVYSVYHPRRARWQMLQILLQEQYGIVKERNILFNCTSHGFWSFPAWVNNGNGVNPQGPMFRVLAEEVFGMTFQKRFNLGQPGENLFLASLYTNSGTGDGVAVLQSASFMPDAAITFTVTGNAAVLTRVDCFGNTTSLDVLNGKVTVAIDDTPTYVRLPSGTSIDVYSMLDMPPSGWVRQGENFAVSIPASPAVPAGSDSAAAIINGALDSFYDQGSGTVSAWTGSADPPTYAGFSWDSPRRFNRLIIWSGSVWQSESTLIDFDIQTSGDGTNWTTQKTVTKAAPSSFVHGVGADGTGTQRETYWDEQWIFNVKLDAYVTARYVRIYVRATSYGGEPDSDCSSIGQGNSSQRVCIKEIGVYADDVSDKFIAVNE